MTTLSSELATEELVSHAEPASRPDASDHDISVMLRIYLLALVAKYRELGLSREKAQQAALLECGCSAPPVPSLTRKPLLSVKSG